jgi:hypothetical protein
MFSNYIEDWEVKPEYSKEFISLWPNWLGEKNLHKLDEVTKDEWARFNNLIRNCAKDFAIEIVDCDNQSITKVKDIDSVLSNYKESMNKDSSLFSKFVLPELECVISEEWDYTYIIWHKNNGAVEALSPYIKKSELKHFNET